MGGADRCCCHWQARDAVANNLGNSPGNFPPPERPQPQEELGAALHKDWQVPVKIKDKIRYEYNGIDAEGVGGLQLQ